MNTVVIAHMLSERNVAPRTEGGIDPLGLAAIADRLDLTWVPVLNNGERSLRPLCSLRLHK